MAEFASPQFKVNPSERDTALRVLDSLEQQLAVSDKGDTVPQSSEATIHQRVRRQIIWQQVASIKELLLNSIPT